MHLCFLVFLIYASSNKAPSSRERALACKRRGIDIILSRLAPFSSLQPNHHDSQEGISVETSQTVPPNQTQRRKPPPTRSVQDPLPNPKPLSEHHRCECFESEQQTFAYRADRGPTKWQLGREKLGNREVAGHMAGVPLDSTGETECWVAMETSDFSEARRAQ